MSRNILITGGTGFIGSRLTDRWLAQGHSVTILSRRPLAAVKRWNRRVQSVSALDELRDARFDTLVNLAGEGIADARWSEARKQILRDSRIRLTESLVQWSVRSGQKYDVVLSGSAVGYYGAFPGSASPELTESSPAGKDFAARLCQDWENVAQGFGMTTQRLVVLRTGLVLDAGGGMLERMRLPFLLGLGGPIADGRQVLSWIHREDYCKAVDFLLESQLSGPVNMTAPNPVSNAGLTRALARALHRPAFLPAPAFALKLLLGEMSELLLKGQKVIPGKLLAADFPFSYADTDSAMEAIFSSRDTKG
ncbi:MAG TPA: TIGR01777 family protein [Oceanospirillales bacterium]|nr:TIGR01777 family protein [Oceanospirillaceae bacterium]HBS41082.1 TIGR01777 family protein [Oceanospirillales bacterium]|tara:strand:+ start:17473 stop:18396 length:924 start_codon:yes stop_codon:yes gene_type:complete